MSGLLFLAHRIPYPPNKGDKIRSFHALQALARRHRVHLGAFVDDDEDWRHADSLREICAEVRLVRLRPRLRKLRSVVGLLTGQALTLPYYGSAALASWVDDLVTSGQVGAAFVYSGAMAQFVRRHSRITRVMDFVDVDSDKWALYAETRRFPLSWLYRREAARLLDFERRIAREFDAAFFVSREEAAHFARLAPEAARHADWYGNGVDAGYFDPALGHPDPFPPGTRPVVFTGAMDYWPNVDAVVWFANEIFPAVRAQYPDTSFYIVGSRPGTAVNALTAVEGVTVTGRVPDIRPYLAHAHVAVAPLRVARGVQNKVLEAMAMARPIVTTPEALEGVGARVGEEVLCASGAPAFRDAVLEVLAGGDIRMGRAARARVLADFDWGATLRPLVAALEPIPAHAAPNLCLDTHGVVA